MEPLVQMVIKTVLANPALQDALAGPVGKLLADALPDEAEDAIGSFLVRIGQKLIEANQ